MEVMKTNDPVFASRPRGAMLDVVSFSGKGIILAPYGEHWRQMRKVCVVELLSARQVRRMERIRQSQLSHLTDSIFIAAASASPTIVVNLSQGFTELTNNVISRAVFGGKCQQQQEYLQELRIVTMLVGGFSLVDPVPIVMAGTVAEQSHVQSEEEPRSSPAHNQRYHPGTQRETECICLSWSSRRGPA